MTFRGDSDRCKLFTVTLQSWPVIGHVSELTVIKVNIFGDSDNHKRCLSVQHLSLSLCDMLLNIDTQLFIDTFYSEMSNIELKVTVPRF